VKRRDMAHPDVQGPRVACICHGQWMVRPSRGIELFGSVPFQSPREPADPVAKSGQIPQLPFEARQDLGEYRIPNNGQRVKCCSAETAGSKGKSKIMRQRVDRGLRIDGNRMEYLTSMYGVVSYNSLLLFLARSPTNA